MKTTKQEAYLDFFAAFNAGETVRASDALSALYLAWKEDKESPARVPLCFQGQTWYPGEGRFELRCESSEWQFWDREKGDWIFSGEFLDEYTHSLPLEVLATPVAWLAFWEGYLVAVAFTCSEDCEDGGDAPEFWTNPGGDVRDVVDSSDVETALRNAGSLERLEAEAKRFLRAALMAGLFRSGDDWERAGADFHLSRNGHGCGFFDGDWNTKPGDAWSEERGDQLQKLAEGFGTAELYWTGDESQGVDGLDFFVG